MSFLTIGIIAIAAIAGLGFLAWAIGLVIINEDKVGKST